MIVRKDIAHDDHDKRKEKKNIKSTTVQKIR